MVKLFRAEVCPMMFSKLLHSPNRRLALLAPATCYVPDAFRHAETDHKRHDILLREMQKLRGAIYLKDGAIEPWQLTKDGCHRAEEDYDSWHLLLLGEKGQIIGCARYLHYENTVSFSEIGLDNSALGQSQDWGHKLRAGVEAELTTARQQELAYVKVGGWALCETLRNTTEGLSIALATWGLAQLLGGCLGIATVTKRHSSSSILRKLGGRSLEANGIELPTYYDPEYKCEMEILRFDSRMPNPRYEEWVCQSRTGLLSIPVICGNGGTDRWNDYGATIGIANRRNYSLQLQMQSAS